jgi:hypothetical protein
MNEFTPAQFVERVERLALGIEPQDALRLSRIALPIDIALDGMPYPASGPRSPTPSWDRLFGFPDPIGSLRRIPRHNSCRHAFLFKPGVKSPVVIRLFDDKRRFVARRISYPVPADIHTPSPPTRIRRPALYPGAAYDVSETATGMRGRVTWDQSTLDEVPVRWVRVEASVGGQIVGRAHGDDRGEFLLLLDSSAVGLADLSSELKVLVTVFGPAAPASPPSNDPLADLPIEVLLVDPDDVSPGGKLPPAYASTASSSRIVSFRLGVLLTHQDKFFFNP